MYVHVLRDLIVQYMVICNATEVIETYEGLCMKGITSLALLEVKFYT